MDKPEFRVERGPTTHEAAAILMAKLLEREGKTVAADMLRRLHAQRDALLEALKLALESGCATVYANEDDERGTRGCCGVLSYKPHADGCWVTKANAAIAAVEGDKK